MLPLNYSSKPHPLFQELEFLHLTREVFWVFESRPFCQWWKNQYFPYREPQSQSFRESLLRN